MGTIVKWIFILIWIGILFTFSKMWIEYLINFANNDESINNEENLIITKPWAEITLDNEEFFANFWNLDYLIELQSYKKFSYVKNIKLVIWKPIEYFEVTCEFNEWKQTFNCANEVKALEKYWQITEIHLATKWRNVPKTWYNISIPSFFFSENREWIQIKTEKKYKININNEVLMQKYKMAFVKLENILQIIWE